MSSDMFKSAMNLKHILGLYEEPSTYKHDYPMYSPQPVRKKIVVNRVSRSSKVIKSSASAPNKMRSYDTLEQLDYSHRLPFNALWEPKNITDISLQQSFCKETIIDKDREDITKVARHANEDTVDSVTQKLIIDFTYETTAELAAKEIWPNFKSKHVCFPNTFEKTANQPVVRQQLTPNFSTGFQSTFKKWDKLQETTFLNTKLDVTLKKKRLPVFHPWLTVSQAITERYADDFSF